MSPCGSYIFREFVPPHRMRNWKCWICYAYAFALGRGAYSRRLHGRLRFPACVRSRPLFHCAEQEMANDWSSPFWVAMIYSLYSSIKRNLKTAFTWKGSCWSQPSRWSVPGLSKLKKNCHCCLIAMLCGDKDQSWLTHRKVNAQWEPPTGWEPKYRPARPRMARLCRQLQNWVRRWVTHTPCELHPELCQGGAFTGSATERYGGTEWWSSAQPSDVFTHENVH